MPRFKRKDVLKSVATARASYPNATIYILSDLPMSAVPGTRRIDSIEDLKSAVVPCAIVLACNSDELAFKAVEFIKKREGMFYFGAFRQAPPARFFHRDEIAKATLEAAAQANLVKYDLPDFENIAQAIHATRLVEGDYVEIGVFMGSSAYFALDYIERGGGPRRQCYLLDTFEGFDYDSAASSADRAWYKTHTDASYDSVKKLLARFTVPHQVIKSNIITDALPAEIKQIAVCNIDVDMYEAVGAALMKVAPLVAEGGIIIVEDQGHTPLLIGAYVAARNFLESDQGKLFVPVELMSGQMFLIKTRNSRP